MPVITINTHSNNEKLDLKVVAEDISVKSGFEIERLNLMVHYFEQSELYNISKSPIIVHVEVCERNGKEAIHKLMKATHRALVNFTKLNMDKVVVYCHPIPNEYLLVNAKFI